MVREYRPTSVLIVIKGHPWRRKDLGDIGYLIELPPLYEYLTANAKDPVFFLLIFSTM